MKTFSNYEKFFFANYAQILISLINYILPIFIGIYELGVIIDEKI